MIRSLRWRLVVATALIIAALALAAGFFSIVTVKREFDRYLIGERMNDLRTAATMIAAGEPLARVHERFGIRTIVVDDAKNVVARYPADLERFKVELTDDGMILRSDNETFRLRGNARRIAGVGTVYFLPPVEERSEGAFRLSVDRHLMFGLAAAALLAVTVMLTVFRQVFAPVDALTKGARALAAGQLDVRVPVRGRDEVGELAQAFNQMAESLERNERARRNMVTDVAHELRTPLTNIRVQVEAAQDGVIAADAKFLRSIEEEVANLSRLVDDLQQLSLADAGALTLELEEVAVRDLVARAAIAHPVTTDVPEDLIVQADPRRLVQVLRNLLVNAGAHARSTIEIRASRVGSMVEIHVSDDGPGVPPEHRERIFDRFHRADASRSRTTGGAGLGLAIAKELVELHGGTIRLEGASTFVLTLRSAR